MRIRILNCQKLKPFLRGKEAIVIHNALELREKTVQKFDRSTRHFFDKTEEYTLGYIEARTIDGNMNCLLMPDEFDIIGD